MATLREGPKGRRSGPDLVARRFGHDGRLVRTRAGGTAAVPRAERRALDHDQSVVGLMALDIAAGRRFPIFFDGQRYMGAVEAYVAAAFTRVLGHAPPSVALAPVLFFGLFVAGQFAVWRLWKDSPTGHLAALLTLLGAPLMTVWGFIPRGGYVESLAWALPTLAVYRAVTRPGAGPLSPARQAGWGFLLAVGYFINPLSQIVHASLAIDWTFARHGDDLRHERGVLALARSQGGSAGLAGRGARLAPRGGRLHPRRSPEVRQRDLLRLLRWPDARPWDVVLGAAGAASLLATAAWWTRLPQRLYRALVSRPWFLLGMLAALSPFVVHFVLVRAGVFEPAEALPAWIRAPWKAWPNVQQLAAVLGTLVGSDPNVLESVLTGQGLALPPRRLPGLSNVLYRVSPLVVMVAMFLLLRVRPGPSEAASPR